MTANRLLDSARSSYGLYVRYFPVVFAFLSGFVFFEPSLAEAAFVVALPGLLAKTAWNRRTWTYAALLAVPAAVSGIYGYVAFGTIDLRFLAIDFYLFTFFATGRSAVSLWGERRERLFDLAFGAMFAASIAGMIAGIIVYAAGDNPAGMRIVYAQRLYGFFKDTNVFASYMLVPFFYFADRFFTGATAKRVTLSAAACIVLSVGILLTFSRAAWLAYGLGLLALLIRSLIRGPASGRIRAAGLIVVFGLVVGILVSGIVKIGNLDISEITTSRLGLVGYDAKRFTAQEKAFEMFDRSPILGVGPGNYEEYSRVSAHSLYHRLLGERGLFGMSAYAAFAILLLVVGWKGRTRPFLAVAAMGILAESFFIDTLHWRHFWLVLVLISTARGDPEITNDKEAR